ncbi:MAG TPA: ABC transporter permease [Bryobacteraceae bacterium]|nr:ABC transporter permease [Bryobacteraceae bacterium]
MLRCWQRRLRYWLHSGERACLLREEMEFHLEMKTQEFVEAGMMEPDARDAARRQFGNPTLQQEESRRIWIARWVSDLMQDTVFAARTLRKQPGFASVAILSAALGIGACSLIFGIANFALFRPLPVDEASGLASIYGTSRRKAGLTISYPDVEDLRRARSFQAVTAFTQFTPAVISSHGEPRRYWGSIVTANYFDVVRPAFIIGRGFGSAKDDTTGQAPSVVLSHQLWQSRFGADRGIVGRTIELNKRKATVLGVTGPGFSGTELAIVSDFWVPFSMLGDFSDPGATAERLAKRSDHWLSAAARLRDGTTIKDAAAEIAVIGERISAASPESKKDRGLHVERAGQVNPGLRKMIAVFFLLLLGVAILVLLTACANVANLLLARASARQKEIATRLAIGAGRGRLVRQLLTESVMLALLGGIAGYGIARLGAFGIGQFRSPLPLPVDFSVTFDYRVLLFCTALSALTGVVFGLVPALRATRPGLVGALKDERKRLGNSRHFGLRNLLVVAQVTICMVLLICSGLFLRSLHSSRAMDTGMAYRNVLMMSFDPGLNRYPAAEIRRIVEAVVENARSIPGVESASLTSNVPLGMGGTSSVFVPDDKVADPENNRIHADIYSVAPRFFDTLGIPLMGGEDFRRGTPVEEVVVVNQALVASAFPEQNPIGRRVSYGGKMFRIIGLVATAKSRTIGEDPKPCLYFPIASDLAGGHALTGLTLLVRTRGNPSGYAPLVRGRIRDIDPALAVFDVRSMDTHLTNALIVPRAAAFLFGLAGFMGLLISTIGIYGVISFGVARQTREIGIRMALGARRAQVLGMVLKQGLVLTVVGSAIGLGLALVFARLAASLLYGISPTDTLTFIGVPLLLLLTAAAACLVPAKRAASLDPLRALRYE